MKRISAIIASLILSLCCVTGLSAQGIITGKITGTVADVTGAIIPGASITAIRASTNTRLTSTAARDGFFSINDLSVGVYTLLVESPGFSPLTYRNVEVGANRASDLGIIRLTTGAAAESVDVSTASNTLETNVAQVTSTFDATQITGLPTGGGFDQLVLLIPGATASRFDSFSNSNGPPVSVNGQRNRSNNFEFDGQSANDNNVGGSLIFFANDEALSQIQIITNNFSAQYGRNLGSVVNYVTKSGSNSFHGSATYRYAGNFTSSRATGVSKGPQFGFCTPGQNAATANCLPTVIPRFVSNKWGGTIGGPVLRDKLWFFGSTYWTRFTQYGALDSSPTALFPTPAGLATLVAAAPSNPAVQILQQLSPYAIAAGNPRQLPTQSSSCPPGSTFNAGNATCSENLTVGGKTISVPFSNFGRHVPVRTSDQEELGRVDYQVTPSDRLYLRYYFQDNPTTPGFSNAAGSFTDVRDRLHSVSSDITHTFNARWLDQLRYSFQQSTVAFDQGGFPTCTIINISSCPSSISLGAETTPLGLSFHLPQGRITKIGQVQNNASWNIGGHSIAFGGEFEYQNSPNTFLPNSAGSFQFPNIQAFLNGGCPANSGCTLTLAAGNPVIPFKENDFAAYFQDDWKVTPAFTANIGLRWEFFQQAMNLLHDRTVAQQTGPNPFWNTSLPLSVTTFPHIAESYHNFEPRLGFAYNPGGLKRVVIRGGYAMNVDPGFYTMNLDAASSAPSINIGSVQCTVAANCLPTGGANYATVSAQDLKFVPRGGHPGDQPQTTVASDLRQPYAEVYTLGAEYEIKNSAVLEIRYTGNHTIRNFQALDGNPYLAPVAADFPNFISPASLCNTSTLPNKSDLGHLYCGSSIVRKYANTASAVYNGFQANLVTRNFHGITSTLAYTWSRTVDNASEIYNTFGAGSTVPFAQNPFDPNVAERGVGGTSYPNVISSSFVYTTPKIGDVASFKGMLLNGWRLSTIWLYSSGQPYSDYNYTYNQSPYVSSDPNSYHSYSDEPLAESFGYGLDFGRPIVSNKNAPASTLGIYTDALLPTGKYGAPFLVDASTGAPTTPDKVHFISNNRLAAKVLGNPFPGSGRNLLRGNTYNNVDAAIFKDTHFGERLTFRLEINAYNVFNRSFYGTPGNSEDGAPYGYFNTYKYSYATGSQVGPGAGNGIRNMEFGGKILF